MKARKHANKERKTSVWLTSTSRKNWKNNIRWKTWEWASRVPWLEVKGHLLLLWAELLKVIECSFSERVFHPHVLSDAPTCTDSLLIVVFTHNSQRGPKHKGGSTWKNSCKPQKSEASESCADTHSLSPPHNMKTTLVSRESGLKTCSCDVWFTHKRLFWVCSLVTSLKMTF